MDAVGPRVWAIMRGDDPEVIEIEYVEQHAIDLAGMWNAGDPEGERHYVITLGNVADQERLRAMAVLWKSRIRETQHHDLPDACEGKTAPEGYEAGLGQCLSDLTDVIGPTAQGPCRRCAEKGA